MTRRKGEAQVPLAQISPIETSRTFVCKVEDHNQHSRCGVLIQLM